MYFVNYPIQMIGRKIIYDISSYFIYDDKNNHQKFTWICGRTSDLWTIPFYCHWYFSNGIYTNGINLLALKSQAWYHRLFFKYEYSKCDWMQSSVNAIILRTIIVSDFKSSPHEQISLSYSHVAFAASEIVRGHHTLIREGNNEIYIIVIVTGFQKV